MTFITNPRDYSHYFQTTLIDFQAAVQPFTKKAGMVVYGSCWLEDVYVILAVGYPSRVEGARFYACK